MMKVKKPLIGKPAYFPYWPPRAKHESMKPLLCTALLLLLSTFALQAQQPILDASLLQPLEWRNVGPFRGGRVVAVTGFSDNPLTYLMGTTGGGLWKTEDAGLSWVNISDEHFNTGSIGAIAVAPSDPNVIYVGTGEHPVRGNMTSAGDGLYRSLDGGKTWEHAGLINSRHISSIVVHPQDPLMVFVAVQGAVHGPSEERGVFRSSNGGKSWQRVLYLNETTGASDITINPANPRILYAAMWDHLRRPWQIRSGGSGSGLYKSTDGGRNWSKLYGGLPEKMGKTGIAVSPANPNRVYAIVEGEQGGVYASTDSGDNWEQTSDDRITIARAWYYTEIVPDPVEEQTVYVLNAPLLKSTDGGRTFEPIPNPHSDQHALWISPQNNRVMILGNDGGATVSLNGGQSWSPQDNQPTAQIYRVIADNRFPYHIYGGQQDNTTIAMPSRTATNGIGSCDWYPVAGGESAFIAFNPDDPMQIYGTSYQGNLSVYDHRTDRVKDIMVYPSLGLGKTPASLKYRFNWNAPLVAQPQDPSILYHAGNVVFRSVDGGLSWEPISPDLTRNEPAKQGRGGVPYTNEGAGAENYNTITYLTCSPHRAGVMWAGSDDGLIHVTRTNGRQWDNVTPPDLGEAMINCIEVSPHDPAAAYVVATRYRFNDLRPMAYYTEDYGQTWTKIVSGISEGDFLHVIREDRERPGLLYGGTERGLYISYDNGQFWQQLQLNLPICPITDLAIKGNDLIAATAGRGFWILDQIAPLQQGIAAFGNEAALFTPQSAVRMHAKDPAPASASLGENPVDGFLIDYYLPIGIDTQQVILNIFDDGRQLVRSFSNQADEDFVEYEGGPKPEALLPTEQGLNRFNWDLRRETLVAVPGVFAFGQYKGSTVPPGVYTIELVLPNQALSVAGRLLPDPRLEATPRDYQEQQEILLGIEALSAKVHRSVNEMRQVKGQVASLQIQMKKADCSEELLNASDFIVQRIDEWESQIVQTQQETYQDVINFPNRFSSDLLDLKNRVDTHDPRVTQGARTRLADLKSEWDDFNQQRQRILKDDIGTFNSLYRQQQLPAVLLPRGAE